MDKVIILNFRSTTYCIVFSLITCLIFCKRQAADMTICEIHVCMYLFLKH
jgi:hypothetical protein